MVICVIGIITYLLTGKAAFLVTGNKNEESAIYNYHNRNEKASWLERLNYKHKAVHILELVLGLVFIYFCVRTFNLALLAFSLSLTLGYFLNKYGWDNKLLKPLFYLPFTLIISAMVFMGINLISVQGLFFFFFPIHF